MTEEMKLLLALDQVGNISKLIEGNPWETFLSSHLISIHYELQRQLTCKQHSAKIKE